jgi:hypothetical protein
MAMTRWVVLRQDSATAETFQPFPVTCYTTPLYVVHFKRAHNSGEGQGESQPLPVMEKGYWEIQWSEDGQTGTKWAHYGPHLSGQRHDRGKKSMESDHAR